MTILVALDGILRSDANTPIREGRILYDALVADGRVVLMVDEPSEKAEYWLKQYGIKGYAGLLSPSLLLTDDDPIRPRQIAVAQSLGRVDMVIDVDPETIVHCYDMDIPSMLFAHPKTTIPGFRPDIARETWTEIETRLARTREREASSDAASV
jgi:hypothetical protein